PGAAHYLIHTYDVPALASRGLPAAQRYAAIAPAVPHALHMPSHIFTQLGLWPESIASNRASAAAATELFDRLHALEFTVYALLQGARDGAAREIVDQVAGFAAPEEGLAGAFAFAVIPARQAIETRRWADASQLRLGAPWDRSSLAVAVTWSARALGAARSGDGAGAT